MSAKVHVGDVNTEFRATVTDQDGAVVDISSASAKQLIFQLPNGARMVKTASLVNSGTDGKMKYLSIAGDLAMEGRWHVQGYVEIGSGQWHTDWYGFDVDPNL